MRVCRAWHTVCCEPALWQHVTARTWPYSRLDLFAPAAAAPTATTSTAAAVAPAASTSSSIPTASSQTAAVEPPPEKKQKLTSDSAASASSTTAAAAATSSVVVTDQKSGSNAKSGLRAGVPLLVASAQGSAQYQRVFGRSLPPAQRYFAYQ